MYEGQNAGDQLGRSVTGLGDLNGDGCDEVAFGSPFEDADGLNNQGVVRVLFGWGGLGCLASERMLKLTSGEVNSQTGFSLGPVMQTVTIILTRCGRDRSTNR